LRTKKARRNTFGPFRLVVCWRSLLLRQFLTGNFRLALIANFDFGDDLRKALNTVYVTTVPLIIPRKKLSRFVCGKNGLSVLCIQTQCKNFCSRVYNKIHFVSAFLYVNIEKSLLFGIDTTTDPFVYANCKMNLAKIHPVCACPVKLSLCKSAHRHFIFLWFSNYKKYLSTADWYRQEKNLR
jgi:hypothetical protein